MTGEPDMALSALNVMLDACQFGYMTNSSNYENGTYSPSPEYKKCPRDCSGNGNCVESRCECANGFEMEDCSVDTRIPPGFTGISGGPVCEAAADAEAEADCFRPVLIGSNMKPGETKCSVRSFTMDANGHKTFETKTTLYPADFLSAYQMMCHLPEVFFTGQALSGYMLSLTNNGGHTYSSETAYQVFNPECMTCDKAESCRIKDGTCMIDNTCFVAGEVEREDNLGTCQPMVNNTAWTKPATAGVITATSTPEPVALNNYTAVGVGCYCYFEPTSADCACCKNYGCPCAEEHKHVCFDCVDDTMCARQN
ncbi:hypothetical protein DPMN_140900 [Dreissena polymorpha]|uniref:Uncharacterized protein n=1 Tax=Dreissena polymorpha TaxID=45954 RepID=A0A9D4JM50_DREPO|nr:hypothetical protein DPMN_140900 [Dreissena polymorpha]